MVAQGYFTTFFGITDLTTVFFIYIYIYTHTHIYIYIYIYIYTLYLKLPKCQGTERIPCS